MVDQGGMHFSHYPIRGIDYSQFQENFYTEKRIQVAKAVSLGISFVSIRVSYGVVTDKAFKESWADARGKTLRVPYHYMDYYSNHLLGSPVYGMSDEDWGRVQARAHWNLIKNDHDHVPSFLDIEKASSGPALDSVKSQVHAIAKGFLEEMDKLNGLFNGMYLPLYWLKWFPDWFRNRTLWVARYYELVTPEQMIVACRNEGWRGAIYMWQYASNGDIDDDGIGDGIRLGMETASVDLNIWIGPAFKFYAWLPGMADVVTPPPLPQEGTPMTKTVELGKTMVNGQLIRTGPGKTYPYVSKMNAGLTIEILGYGKDVLNNPWVRVGPNLWAAQTYGGVTYIEKLVT